MTDANWRGLSYVFQVFEDWNKGELDSFLIEISKDILKFKDSDGECATSWHAYW
jgi:6-phosphogluconate dehydrogenase